MSASPAPPAQTPPRDERGQSEPPRDDKLQRLLDDLREAVIRAERDRPIARVQLSQAQRSIR